MNTEIEVSETKVNQPRGVIGRMMLSLPVGTDSGRGLVYTDILWRTVISKPEIQHRMALYSMLGEFEPGNHPEIVLFRVSHAITEIIPVSDSFKVSIAILNTPRGLALKKACDRKEHLCITPRGLGTCTPDGFIQVETYELITLDIDRVHPELFDPSVTNPRS